MGWGQWVHAGNVAEEGVPAALNNVSYVREASVAGYLCVFHFIELSHAEYSPLTSHVKCLQVSCVSLSHGPRLRGIE